MNIHELEKKATPGPLTVWWPLTELNPDIEPCGEPLLVAWDENDDSTLDVASVSGEGKGFDELRANTFLLAHCRNHFMEALSMLKKCKTVIEALGCAPSPELLATIAKLETAKSKTDLTLP